MSEPDPWVDPWADPSTETRPGAPYAGPPTTAPPGPGPAGSPYGPYGGQPYGPYGGQPYGPYGGQPYGQPYSQPYGWPGPPHGWPGPPYGAPYGWVPPPAVARRPGQVIAAAVLAFVQAGIVAVSSVYVFFIASIAGTIGSTVPGAQDSELQRLSVEGTTLAAVQLATILALVAGGILALNRRRLSSWWWLIGALASQVVLAVYWVVRLSMLTGTLGSDGGSAGAFAVLALFFAAGPVVGIILTLVGPARGWFAADRNGQRDSTQRDGR